MKKVSSVILLFTAMAFLSGCSSWDNYFSKNRKYRGKLFTVRTELGRDRSVEVLTWTNANMLTYDSEDSDYSFYVDGKLVVLQPRGTLIVEEQ